MHYTAALVHLSDIECGAKNRASEKNIVHPYAKCADRLIDDLRKELIGRRKLNPDQVGLVITGDCADKGGAEPGEYKNAARIIERVRDNLGIPRDLVAVVPGNHDVNWVACRSAYIAHNPGIDFGNAALRETARTFSEKFEGFRQFLQRICDLEYPGPEAVLPFPGFARLGFAVVGLDTTFPCTFCKEDNYGILRDDQVRLAGQELQHLCESASDLIPLALLHHCPIPSHDELEERSYLRNARQAIGWLNTAGFHTVLCGHEHQTRLSLDGRRLHQVLTSGSFGLNTRELLNRYQPAPRLEPNKYQILLAHAGGMHELLFRKLDPVGVVEGVWGPDEDDGAGSQALHLHRRWGRTGGDVLAQRIHALLSRPVWLPGRRHCVLAMAVGAAEDVLAQLRRVIYVVGDRSYASDDRAQQFLAHAEVDVTSEAAVEIRVLTGGGRPESVGTFELLSPQDID